MKKLSRLMLVLCLVVVFAFTACTSTTPTPSPDDGEQQTATVTGLEFEQARQEFSLGEDFTSEGLRVLKVMSDGTKPVVAPKDLTVDSSAYNKNEAGTYTIRVTLTGTDFSVTYEVTVGGANEYSDSLKILAIGNSFSENAMKYMWDIATAFGIEEVVTANMYIGGCSLATHRNNAENNISAYQMQKNTTGTIVRTNNYNLKTALKEEDWDIITIQQVSGLSGVVDTYDDDIDYLIDFIEDNKNVYSNPQIYWHMTWAYAANSTHSDFPRYDRNQMTMYNKIVEATNAKIDTNDKIDGVVPAGTAVQNARSSYIGDNLTADGYHLNSNGEFIAGLTWIHKITGYDVDDMDETLIPAQFLDRLDIYKESVENAVAHPYEVTQSQYTEAPVVVTFPVMDFEELEVGMQYRNQPVTNWVNLTADVVETEGNVIDKDSNKVFVFKPTTGGNMYGFRLNFEEGTLEDKHAEFVFKASAETAGNYSCKIYFYYANGSNKEITPQGTGVSIALTTDLNEFVYEFDSAALGVNAADVTGYSLQFTARDCNVYADDIYIRKSSKFQTVTFDTLESGYQYREMGVTNWEDLTEAVASEQHNVVDLNDNRVFAFQPMEGTNLYGFRHNFAAGTLNSDLDTISFDMAVGAGDEGDYVIKMWMYYENGSNKEITTVGTGWKVTLDDSFKNFSMQFVYEELGVDIDNITGYSIQTFGNGKVIYMDNVSFTHGEPVVKKTVTFHTQGGSDIDPVTQSVGSRISVGSPRKDNFSFGGWYLDVGCTQPFDMIVPATDTTVYAKWNPVADSFATVTFDDLTNLQYREMGVNNWTAATEANITEIEGNKAFVFESLPNNLYGFRQNFTEGTLSSALDTIAFDMAVGAGDEGDYVIKMWMYFGTSSNKEITTVGVGHTVSLDQTFKTIKLTFDYAALGINIDSINGYSIQTYRSEKAVYMDNVRFEKSESASLGVVDFNDLTGIQFRKQPDINWTDMSDEVVTQQNNIVTIEENKVFAFQPVPQWNMYGFRQNFAEGTLNADLNSVSFDMFVGAGDEGNYVIKMWMYYENGSNREVTIAGTGNTVALDTTVKTITIDFDYAASNVDIDKVTGYSINTFQNEKVVYMDNVQFKKSEPASLEVIDFDDLTDLQYREMGVTNWEAVTEENITDLNGNNVFTFQPIAGTNLYGFRHNFQAGAFSGTSSFSFELAVAGEAAAGEYTYKIFLYYGNSNTEITSGGKTVTLDTELTTFTFDIPSTVSVDLGTVTGYSIQFMGNANVIYMDNVALAK